MKSHMLTSTDSLSKPWLSNKSPRATFSYYIVYFIIFVGFAGGAVQSLFRYKNVPIDKSPLCLAFEENFDSEETVFGKDAKGGTFFREVSMDGFG